jgi:hypothetical protein
VLQSLSIRLETVEDDVLLENYEEIQYDQRNSRISIDKVSIMTLQGRLKLATRVGDYQR